MKEGRSVFKILKGKRSLGWPGRRWEDNIRMDLKRNRHEYEELG